MIISIRVYEAVEGILDLIVGNNAIKASESVEIVAILSAIPGSWKKIEIFSAASIQIGTNIVKIYTIGFLLN